MNITHDTTKTNAQPEQLLAGKPTRAQKELYNYIQAFKISGGERKSLVERNRVLRNRFKDLLEG